MLHGRLAAVPLGVGTTHGCRRGHLADQAPKLEDGTYAPYEWRCADAIVELASSRLGELDRATVVVHVDAERLNHINGTGAFEGGSCVISETIRRLACDGKVQLCVDDEHGRPLKLGRMKRTVSPWQARQIRQRDIRKDEQDRLRFIRPDGRPLGERPVPLDQRVRERMFGDALRE